MLTIRVNGQPLRALGPGAASSPATIEYGVHGCEAASWEMDPAFRHPYLRGNATVQVWDGGFLIWSGLMKDPSNDGKYSAKGLWHQATTLPALDGSGNFTAVPDTALTAAVSRGDIGWGLPAGGVSASAWVAGQPDSFDPSGLTLADLLDGYCTQQGLRWGTDGRGLLFVTADPTVPMWHVPYAVYGRGLTPSEDEFVTHLVGRYMVGGGLEGFVTVGSAEAASAFGRKVKQVDIMDMGPIGSTQATDMLTGMFLLSGARMGWAEPIEVSVGQLTNKGGGPASFAQVQSLQMVRLAGTVDTSRANRMPAYTDLVIGGTRYTDGSGRMTLTPLGYSPRNLSEILKVNWERV